MLRPDWTSYSLDPRHVSTRHLQVQGWSTVQVITKHDLQESVPVRVALVLSACPIPGPLISIRHIYLPLGESRYQRQLAAPLRV